MDSKIELIPVLRKDDIHTRIVEIARIISSDFQESELVLIGVLKGAFIFLSDLVRHLSVPVMIDFIELSSYENKTETSGSVRLLKDIRTDIRGKNAIIVEDIADTGLTLEFLTGHLKTLGPKRVKICALLDKRSRRESNIMIDYACHVVGDGFYVGYGLDYAEKYRNLPDIYHLKFLTG